MKGQTPGVWIATPRARVPAWVRELTGLTKVAAIIAKWGIAARFERAAPAESTPLTEAEAAARIIDEAHTEALELDTFRTLNIQDAAAAIAEAPEQRPNKYGWTRIDSRPWGKLAATWSHPAGWSLRHCGHPTAHHSWILKDEFGRMLLTGAKDCNDPEKGTAWTHLEDAQAWASSQIAAALPLEVEVAADARAARTAVGLDDNLQPLLLEVQEPPSPRRAEGWHDEQLDLFQRSLCEAPVAA